MVVEPTGGVYVLLVFELDTKVESNPIMLQKLCEGYAAGAAKFTAKALSQITTGEISDNSTSITSDLGNLLLPQQFDAAISYFARQSKSGQDFKAFLKDLHQKENHFKALHDKYTELVSDKNET